jgi:hypothetical protein
LVDEADQTECEELMRGIELVVGILIFATLALSCVVVWLLWTTIRIRGSVRKTREVGETKGSVSRLDAELFVETYRSKRRQKDRGSDERVT